MSYQININEIEKKINNIGNIEKWDEKLNLIKDIKLDIKKENNNIDNLLSSLDNTLIKNKDCNIDKIIIDFDNVDLTKKIKYYKYLNTYIKNIENELFN
jgi:hypothetical protein